MPQNLGPQGLSMYPAEVHMLETILELGGASITALARETGITKGAVSQLVGRLAEKNLVEKTLDKDNRSRLIVRCTRSGHEVCAGHNTFHQEHDKAFIDYLRQMDEVDFKAVCDFGQKLNSWMDGYLK
ncbi:MAG: MarR family winged helix-turn-helix transcriptional regulator [Desulfovibrio sp.]|uniref:MarR family winged helix-turn-helix transcriptional regulator n=1 Tax=Desulfovibrio sp. 7SRBS1 TaxID=3378064 RepID=UPI003B3D2330